MARFLSLAALLVASLALFLSLQKSGGSTNGAQSAKTETAFERVMRTGVLRCAYYVFPPVTYRDPNTRRLSGLSVDMMEQMTKSAAIKVEWTEEIDFGSWQPGLKAKRFDAVCTPMWPDASLAREALFTRPMFYAGIYPYVRSDDHRFDDNLAAINDPKVTIVVRESDPMLQLAQQHFPKAKLLVLAPTEPAGAEAANVLAQKADVRLWDPNGAAVFNKSNSNGLRNVASDHPLKVMPFELMVGLGEQNLRDWLDVGLQTLEDTGAMPALIDKWEVAKGSFIRMAKPYSP